MAAKLRTVRSLEDIQFNFEVLAFALANISPDQISPGAIGAAQISGEVMPRSGGSFTGSIQAPQITVTQKLSTADLESTGPIKAASGEISGNFVAGAVSTDSLTKGGLPVPVTGGDVSDLAAPISNPPTQDEVTAIRAKINELLAVLRQSGSLAT